MIKPPTKTWKTGSGKVLQEAEWVEFRNNVYEYLFHQEMKWTANMQSVYYNGSLIHYSDFMKAKRGSL